MSVAVLPSLAGLGFDVTRSPQWSSSVQQAISGKETRLGYQTFPRWTWELTYNILRSDATNTELQQLAGFFNARQGMLDTFLYQDADDNAVTGQALGTGDGATNAFQLIRAFGGFIEPVLAPHAVSAVKINGIAIPSGGYSAPTNGALTSTSAGALGATTNYVRTTWVTASGETAPSVETSLVVSANRVLNVAAPASPPAGALGWNIYVSNTVMGGSGAERLQSGQGVTTPWVEPTSGLLTGTATPPASNTTGWSVSNWGTSAPGVLTFAGNMANSSGLPITADFSYYWPVRMTDDSVTFTMFMTQYYSSKKFSFISVKN